MKTHGLLLVALLLVTFITFSNFIAGYAGASVYQQPTPAPPPPNEDELIFDPGPTAVPLPKPLETPEEVLQQLLVYDAGWAEWAEPWGLETLVSDPERITLEQFSSRGEESKALGLNEWFHPSTEANVGSVWSITIRGNVRLRMIGVGIEGPVAAEGVNYVLSARTGNLLAIRGGLPEDFK